MTPRTLERSTVTPRPGHEEAIHEFSRFLAAAPAADDSHAAHLVSSTGERHELPQEVYEILKQVTEALAAGKGISVVPTNMRLTTQQAADHLGISRPTLVKLLETEEIPHTKVGRHRRVLLEDLIAYEERTRRERHRALDELTAAAKDGTYFRPLTGPTR